MGNVFTVESGGESEDGGEKEDDGTWRGNDVNK